MVSSATMETHQDWLGLAGLIAALIALGVAIFGIKDVRKLVRDLIKLERNRVWTRVLHGDALKFVEPLTETAARSDGGMHEFIMLVRALEPELSLDDAQNYANHEVLCLAQEMVTRGMAKWRPNIDEDAVKSMIDSWQADKNTAILRNMFSDNLTTLKGDPRNKMIKH